jgi:2-keto-4-pentenoate hydratase
MTTVRAGQDQRRARAAEALLALSKGAEPTPEDLASLHAYDDSDGREGLDLQLAVLELWRRSGEEVGGWKIAWTSRAARDRGGPGFRPFGFVLASRIFADGASIAGSTVPNGLLEPEICLIMGERLAGPEVSVEQARQAVRSVAPAFEICARRMPSGLSLAARIGNDMNNWGMVVGPAHSPDIALDGLAVELVQNDRIVATGSSAPDVLDDPYLSLTRVCRELHTFGLGLEAGHAVITGSVAASAKLAEPGPVEASFGQLGSVRVKVV